MTVSEVRELDAAGSGRASRAIHGEALGFMWDEMRVIAGIGTGSGVMRLRKTILADYRIWRPQRAGAEAGRPGTVAVGPSCSYACIHKSGRTPPTGNFPSWLVMIVGGVRVWM